MFTYYILRQQINIMQGKQKTWKTAFFVPIIPEANTKAFHDWKIVYKESFFTRSEAVKRESEIKNKKSRKYIEFLISSVC